MDATRPSQPGVMPMPSTTGCKATVIIGTILLGIVAALGFCGCQRFGIIDLDENAKKAWADVQSVYQRRADLIPNLVEVVKGAANYESSTHKDIVDAQNKLLGIHREFKELIKTEDPASIERMYSRLVDAQKRWLESTVTAFPNLKAVENYTTLMVQVEGTENRISVERMKYNKAVADYNAKTRKWGWMPFCGGFPTRTSFTADEGSDKAPKIDFKKERSG